MATYDLYAIDADSIAEAKELVERVLSVPFFEHDSGFHRGPYFSAGKVGGENFEIKFNMDPYEDEPSEDKFPDDSYLLYINNTDRSDSLEASLTDIGKIHLLRRVNM